jgi:CMP-N-acetylneuraminic acid synthetase
MQDKPTTKNTSIKPKVLGVIPARGSSKRLPNKNIRMLAGKPLVAWTIEAAQKAKQLTDYLVSADALLIMDIAKNYGAPVPFKRPPELATDTVRNIEVVAHALEFMETKRQMIYDIIVLLQPTSPIRNPTHIDEAILSLWESDLDSIASVKGPFKKRDPILKAIRNGILEDYCPVQDPANTEAFYLYNAALYGVKRDYFIKHKKLISAQQVPLMMDPIYSVDVDTEVDFLMAETYLNYLAKKTASPDSEKKG